MKTPVQLSGDGDTETRPNSKNTTLIFDHLRPSAWIRCIADRAETIDSINRAYRRELMQGHRIFPAIHDTFRVFNLIPPEKISVVILGQDPYHGAGQADGLAFSVRTPILPPSLKNIFREIELDTGTVAMGRNGNLERWAEQGVFLLNTILSVREKMPLSHRHIGWELFTDHIVRCIQNMGQTIVFLLWGRAAQRKRTLIDSSRHIVIETSHPSPLGYYRGFKHSGQFRKVNQIRRKLGQPPIDW